MNEEFLYDELEHPGNLNYECKLTVLHKIYAVIFHEIIDKQFFLKIYCQEMKKQIFPILIQLKKAFLEFHELEQFFDLKNKFFKNSTNFFQSFEIKKNVFNLVSNPFKFY